MKAVYKITNTVNNKIYIGSSKRVEKRPKSKSKLSEEQILEIIRLYQLGVKQVDIANMFDTNQGYVSHIVNKKVRQYIG